MVSRSHRDLAEDRMAERSSTRNYAFYRYLIDCIGRCADSADRAKETTALLRKLHESVGERERAPLLAILELDLAVGQEVKASDKDWTRDVDAYWSRWGSKGPIVSEFEGIVKGDDGKRAKVIQMLQERSQNTHVSQLVSTGAHS